MRSAWAPVGSRTSSAEDRQGAAPARAVQAAVRPGRKIGHVDGHLVRNLLLSVALLELGHDLVFRPSQNRSGHPARVLQSDAAMAERTDIALEQTFRRRVMHVNRMFVGEQDFQFAQSVACARPLANIVGNLAAILPPIDR